MSLITKSALRSSVKSKLEFLSIVFMIAVSISLYVASQMTYESVVDLFRNYVRTTYGDILVVGYVPSIVDEIVKESKFVRDFTGFVVVPAYATDSQGIERPVLLGYTEAAYRNDTLLGGFKAIKLKEGQALLLREGSDGLSIGMKLTAYPTISINEESIFNLTIVGYVEGGLPLPAGPVLFLSKSDGKKLLEVVGGYTVYSVVRKDGISDNEVLTELIEIIKNAGGYVGFVFDTNKDLKFYPGQGVLNETVIGLKFISLTSWIVVTIVLVIFSIMYIEKNVKEVATLRSIGGAATELSKYIIALWGSRLLSGLILGILISYLLTKVIIASALSHPRLQPFQDFVKVRLPPMTIVETIILSLTTLLLIWISSLVAVYKMRLIDALTFYGIKLRIKGESRLPFFMIVGLSEIRTLPWRNIAAIILLSLGIALISLPFTLSSSLLSFNESKSFDVKVIMMIIPKISPSLSYFLSNADWSKANEVSIWVESLYGSVNIKAQLIEGNKKVPIYATSCLLPFKGKCIDFISIVKGRMLKYPNETIVSTLFSYRYNVRVGDEIAVSLTTKGTKERVISLKVVGIYNSKEFPPTIILHPALLPPIDSFSVFTILIKTKYPEELSNYIRSFLVSNAYAAVSMTWDEYEREMMRDLTFVADSIKTTVLSSYIITTLAVATFAISDLSVRRKIWMLLKSLGMTSVDLSLAFLFRWAVIGALSIPISYILLTKWTTDGVEMLSQVYFIDKMKIDCSFIIVGMLAPLAIFVVSLAYFKKYRSVEELRNA
ncbi:hypothetical protein EYM_03960 [Ignicoccus islandicus DSM 13165]|uniref:ABC3 transporter permease C-terminal domain-containing protein n=1 Tax=Ignicoccus islandicus DSM 13165 TaxID=940295 RepID=A0A0U3FKU5_9CREN|nr:FtsX-like permease family protein [Ignicoccus islandicus]ALU12454.1 hypothetical protein EYM_03960 [Ignicoccus islandicus DSM 13165]